MQDSLFQNNPAIKKNAPLAERCRPQILDEIYGQESILAPGKALRLSIENDQIPSMILWGPPGSGKTTLAQVLARVSQSHFVQLSATDSGIKDLRRVISEAETLLQSTQQRTLLFIDEIHRWNKSQQDALLPYVESGLIKLVGATTENPSFEINGALLSRTTVYTLSQLQPNHVIQILQHGLDVLNQEGTEIKAQDDALEAIASVSHGDARVALGALEQCVLYLCGKKETLLNAERVKETLQDKRLLYDKAGEEHYNTISALHKCMRGSDPQAAIYWMARMLEAGEDPMYIARRIIRFAAEDVGLADPNALLIAIAARDTYHTLGSPEGELALVEAAVYMATAPKSNSLYKAFAEAKALVKKTGFLPVPKHIRNAPTQLMKDLDYGKGYEYSHDYENAYTGQSYLPDKIKNQVFYTPTDRGFEKKIQERMKFWDEIKKAK